MPEKMSISRREFYSIVSEVASSCSKSISRACEDRLSTPTDQHELRLEMVQDIVEAALKNRNIGCL